MKPTNLRLHSKASRLISRACGQTWRYLHDWPLLHFPSSNNVLGKWGGQKGLVLPCGTGVSPCWVVLTPDVLLLPTVDTVHHGGPVARLLSVKSEFSFVNYSAHTHPVRHARNQKIPTLVKLVLYWGR